jgi:hypothetical protein
VKVVGYPPPDNRAFGYGWYRLGFVLWNEGDPAGARAAFAQASSYAATFAQLPGSSALASASSAAVSALVVACPGAGP